MISALFTAAAIATGPFGEIQHTRDNSFCETCVSTGQQGIQTLVNQLLNVGIVGGCSKLCSALDNPNRAKVCDGICTIVGIKEFAKVLSKADLDPIYYCEILKACPVGRDDASITVDKAVVSPTAGPEGTTFAMQLQFTAVNATGVGEVEIGIKAPSGKSVGGKSFLNTGFAPGKYASNVSFTPKDDYSKQPPLVWQPGTYTFAFKVCQGECGSAHPHSKVFGTTSGTFEISK